MCALAILGSIIGATATTLTLESTSCGKPAKDSNCESLEIMLGVVGCLVGLNMGVAVGKLIGTAYRAAGWGFFWKEPQQYQAIIDSDRTTIPPPRATLP